VLPSGSLAILVKRFVRVVPLGRVAFLSRNRESTLSRSVVVIIELLLAGGDIESYERGVVSRSLVGLNECLLVLLPLLLTDCSPAIGLVILPVMISLARIAYLLAFSSSVSKH
jgi:hypothetical protein